jgi:transporter family protein
MQKWLVASIGWALAVGTLGVTIKLSLRHTTWPVIMLAVTIVYVLLALALGLKGLLKPMPRGGALALLAGTAILTAGSFPLLIYALRHADASRVAPITATYPLVTVILSVLLLGEALTRQRVIGVVCIVAGVVLVSR